MHDQRGTVPVWGSLPESRALDRDGDSPIDLLVVGAGIAGLTTAYLAAREGRRVVVLDAGAPGSGETRRTSAHLSSALDDRFTALERLRGRGTSRGAAQAHAEAIDTIEHIVREEGIDCGFARIPGYLFPAPGEDAETLAEEREAARRAGLLADWAETPVETWPGRCLRFENQARFEPLRYLDGLRAGLERLGGRVLGGSAVTAVEGGAPIRARTRDGRTYEAAAAVVATNSPFVDHVALQPKLYPYRTYAIAVACDDGAAPDALLWDEAEPYHYVRPLRTDEGTLLIVGGEDNKTGQADDAEARWSRLLEFARERFSAVGEVRARWSGQVLETVDGLAYVGADPAGAENVYVIAGDSGMGLTHGTAGARLLVDLTAGREHPWKDLFDPKRKPLKSLGTVVSENVNVARQYADWIRVASGPEPARGEGLVVKRDGRPVALYRGDDGVLHARSAVCTHLRCIVRFNPAEKSWDCPCHGSRFGVDGRVLTAPAHHDLPPADED